ncbi:phosphoribulokinase [Spongiibacter pelagi]|uniref:phosphoribulokinase n=1 Tax=Spongiibacter pelagi TaxID=2760804 RepID=UPI001CC25416|nr:phosphoribulokinase [Spongiibacter pelagi]
MVLAAEKLQAFLVAENLPDSYGQQAEHFFLPLLESLLPAIRSGRLKVLGIHGAQGSGKSTLADLYRYCLQELGLTVAQLSLDDFYLTKAERLVLSQTAHSLLKTRGVPGTHDVALGMQTIAALKTLGKDETLALPRFDKLNDDRYPEDDWPEVEGPVDVIIFEGWCLGVPAQRDTELAAPVNALERNEDQDGTWRRYANAQLAASYQNWFAEIDYLVMLRAPSFECVAQWRLEQEQRLAAKESGKPVMDAQQIERFVQHYERLTRYGLSVLPERADCVLALAEDRRIIDLTHSGERYE